MRSITKNKVFLITFGFIFTFFTLINTNFSHYVGNNCDYFENKNKTRSRISGYWNLTVNPINIIGNSGWESLAATEDWCSGSGTWGDPYIIENVFIDGQGITSHGIRVVFSDANFIIRNSIIINTTVNGGISLQDVSNGILQNNTWSFNKNGIDLVRSNNITILENTAMNNELYGVHVFFSSYNNLVLRNNASFNEMTGISIASSSDNNTVSENIVKENQNTGIYLYNSSNNVVKDNQISDNFGFGISISTTSSNNIMKDNLILNTDEYGAYIDTTSRDNIFSNNSFINNDINARDDGINNNWDNGTLGNYWDDYSGNDKNDDGIGDIPYNISGFAGSVDNFPIWEDGTDAVVAIPVGNFFIIFLFIALMSLILIQYRKITLK